MARRTTSPSIAVVRADLLTAKVLVWVASVGRDADLTPQAHLYFFDRYARLAEYHRGRGNATRARQLQAKAEEHYRLSGGDGPHAAAMGMPRPRQWIVTDAVSKQWTGPDDAA